MSEYGDHARRARPPIQERKLAEHISRPEAADRPAAHLHSGAALQQHEHGATAPHALTEHEPVRAIADDLGPVGERTQSGLGHPREQRNGSKDPHAGGSERLIDRCRQPCR